MLKNCDEYEKKQKKELLEYFVNEMREISVNFYNIKNAKYSLLFWWFQDEREIVWDAHGDNT